MRTKFGVILMLMLMFLFLIGCGSSNNKNDESKNGKNSDADGEITLRMSWWGSQDRHDRTLEVIKLYEENNPGVKISPEFSGWDGYWEKLTTQAAGKNLPDIIQMDYKFLGEYVDNGLLENLNPYIEDGIMNFDNVDSQYLDGGKIDDKLYAMNIGANAYAIVIDPQKFEEAGVDILEPGYTWEDLKDIGKQLSDNLGEGVYGLEPAAGIMGFKHYLRENEKWLYSDDGTSLGYEDDQLLEDFLQITVDMLESGAATPPEIFKDTGGSLEQSTIVEEKSAILLNFHNNQLVAIEEAAGRPFELMIQPMLEGGELGHYIKPGQFLSVSSHTKQAEEAAKFLDFFTNDLEANRILNGERGVPISEKVREDLKENLNEAGQKMFDYLDLVAEYATEINPPDPPGSTEIEDYFTTQIEDAIYYNQITPKEAAEKFRKDANEILAKNK